jgi:hypothetical protein
MKEVIEPKTCEVVEDGMQVEISPSVNKIRNNLWIFGIHSWLFGIADRGFAAFADGYLSAIEITHLFMASFFFVSWLYLKPERSLESESVSRLQSCQEDAVVPHHPVFLQAGQARMLELHNQHMISQEYILPFPYECQIYHLLNLKHLETIHGFSLNHLKVISVSDIEPTAIGGRIKFQTMLDSPYNPLRIWRQPIVEVDLVLHSPYTVELSIPVYSGKRITVIFNALPLDENEHKLFIDIYTDLEWPKPILQVLLHFASCLTLFEDLPYLRKLAERNVDRLVRAGKTSSHETMWLFKRFADLYGSKLGSAPADRRLTASQERRGSANVAVATGV